MNSKKKNDKELPDGNPKSNKKFIWKNYILPIVTIAATVVMGYFSLEISQSTASIDSQALDIASRNTSIAKQTAPLQCTLQLSYDDSSPKQCYSVNGTDKYISSPNQIKYSYITTSGEIESCGIAYPAGIPTPTVSNPASDITTKYFATIDFSSPDNLTLSQNTSSNQANIFNCSLLALTNSYYAYFFSYAKSGQNSLYFNMVVIPITRTNDEYAFPDSLAPNSTVGYTYLTYTADQMLDIPDLVDAYNPANECDQSLLTGMFENFSTFCDEMKSIN